MLLAFVATPIIPAILLDSYTDSIPFQGQLREATAKV